MPPSKINLAVIGVGGVGTAFLSQVAGLPSALRPTLIFLSRSSKQLYTPNYDAVSASSLPSSSSKLLSLPELTSYLSSAPGKTVLVDNTSNQDVANAYPSFLRKGISVVTPNKKAFSSTSQLWTDIFDAVESSDGQAMVYHESSVGAGLPVISTLKDLVATGDQVTRIEGVFSGTMSFLFNSFAPADGSGKGKWSEIVSQAKDAGYTEPDPRDDLNGMDVARKLTILARLAGLKVEGPESFPVQSLIPKELESAKSSDEFMQKLPEFDGEMEGYKDKAAKEGKVVRYVGSVDVGAGKVKVGLEMVEKGTPIASLTGSDNLICFYTKRYGANPLVIQGAGAGGEVTAMGVTADLIKVVERLR
ncbi:Homoserine dehydrogenase [Elasticomyces elasticus]|uniref:Homoserine dehydrogenase n=1 Tax=Exophiala sideris TaxID=1016849 RepID=A0ABR0JLP5_9EURO|nr:Homoserine dehydrogenase [Elasticomyces elasticus]KAK5035449.1 Homoserine dehydrogenase [Exophiala sideris]KAK5039200.1 Homoserine dehydrogenase [Exophiala sideris]KAK5066374.1 Homoserine dehydrogenase [Exophiala sideris]KAK5187051.1 Homoserine dehydrogenase [Eurotiomycetes sp. CCFEE 6388]